MFKFLKHKHVNFISNKKLLIYVSTIILIVIIGQVIPDYLEPYRSENIKNQKFIKTEIKSQQIKNTITFPIKQTFFNNYIGIELENKMIFRPNFLEDVDDEKIFKNAIIEKKANSRIVNITSEGVRYKFNIVDLNNNGSKIFLFICSLFIGFIMIPLKFKQSEFYKEYEKNTR